MSVIALENFQISHDLWEPWFLTSTESFDCKLLNNSSHMDWSMSNQAFSMRQVYFETVIIGGDMHLGNGSSMYGEAMSVNLMQSALVHYSVFSFSFTITVQRRLWQISQWSYSIVKQLNKNSSCSSSMFCCFSKYPAL